MKLLSDQGFSGSSTFRATSCMISYTLSFLYSCTPPVNSQQSFIHQSIHPSPHPQQRCHFPRTRPKHLIPITIPSRSVSITSPSRPPSHVPYPTSSSNNQLKQTNKTTSTNTNPIQQSSQKIASLASLQQPTHAPGHWNTGCHQAL